MAWVCLSLAAVRLEHGHSPEEIRQRLSSRPGESYLRDWVYGGIDGAVTTFAVAAGVAGASLSPQIVLILGFANLLADGFSMAVANYSGTKTEREQYERLIAIEHKHIAAIPEVSGRKSGRYSRKWAFGARIWNGRSGPSVPMRAGGCRPWYWKSTDWRRSSVAGEGRLLHLRGVCLVWIDPVWCPIWPVAVSLPPRSRHQWHSC